MTVQVLTDAEITAVSALYGYDRRKAVAGALIDLNSAVRVRQRTRLKQALEARGAASP